MTREFVTVTFADGESLNLGSFQSNAWDATVGESGNLIIETPKGVSCFARGHWVGFHSTVLS